eukprot:gene2900-3167_t
MFHLVKTIPTQLTRPLRGKAFATLLVERHGAPAHALKLNPAKASVNPKADEDVVVNVKASQITLEDIKQIRGNSFNENSLGVGGTAAVGVVTSSKTSAIAAGDSVFVLHEAVWADSIAVPKTSVFKLPKLTTEQAAVFPTYLTAWGILSKFTTIKHGDTILQNNGGSAIADAIEQIGKARGFNVLSVKNADLADPTVVAGLREKSKTKYVVSGVPGKTTGAVLKALSYGGTLVVYEGLYQPISRIAGIDIPVSSAIFSSSHIVGFDLATWTRQSTAQVQQAITTISALLETKALSVPAESFPVEKYEKAFTSAEHSAKATVLTF